MTLKFRDQRVPGGPITRWYVNAASGALPVSPYSVSPSSYSPQVGKYKSIDSVIGGKFQPGVFRVNPVTIKESTATCTIGTCYARYYQTSPAMWIGQKTTAPFALVGFNSDFLAVDAFDTMLGKQSLVKAYDKVKSAESDIGVMLVELNETIHMLRHPFEALSKMKSKLKKNRYKRHKGNEIAEPVIYGSVLSDLWLQYRYGIIPLVNDISSIIDLFNKQVASAERLLHRRKGMIETVKNVNITQSLKTLDGFCWTPQRTEERKIRSVSHVYFHTLLQAGANWQLHNLGLNLGNLPTVVWEKIPYSFVVDWFVGVSRWLTAVKADPFHQYLGNCTSQVYEQTIKYDMSTPYYGTYKSLEEFRPSTYTMTSKVLIRHINDTLPVLPVINADFFTWKRELDSLSLIWQRTFNRRH